MAHAPVSHSDKKIIQFSFIFKSSMLQVSNDPAFKLIQFFLLPSGADKLTRVPKFCI